MNLTRCCRVSIDGKNTSMDREYVENLSARQKEKEGKRRKKLLRIKKGSIEGSLSRICWKAVELEENRFSRREKHIEMNATSKLLKHRSNQHIKLSKHLLTYKQIIHRSKTHTHTTSLTNFIFQKQVKTV